jgi:hypothetical protein
MQRRSSVPRPRAARLRVVQPRGQREPSPGRLVGSGRPGLAGTAILVEARADPRVAPVLDAIAAVCRDQGHRVVRWRGPFSGAVPYPRDLPPCGLAILWNGTHPRYAGWVQQLRRGRIPILFAELDWFESADGFQLDPRGINARAGWAKAPLGSTGGEPLPVRASGDLLVLVQDDADTPILVDSPRVRHGLGFVEHLARHACLPLRLRPAERLSAAKAAKALASVTDIPWDRSASLDEALAGCRAVATINASAALAALAAGLPVLCYGEAVYRHPGAVYCMTADADQTRAITAELAAGRSALSADAVAELLARLRAQQWTLAELPRRLPPLLRQVLEPSAERGAGDAGRRLRLQRPLPDHASGPEAMLAVVIPYRGRFDALEVLLQNVAPNARTLWCVVNLGDPDPSVPALCRERAVRHDFIDHNGVFEIGACMNHAAQHLACRYLLLQDVDCLPPPGFYDRLLGALDELDGEAHPAAFMLIGCYYANQAFSARHLQGRLAEGVGGLLAGDAGHREPPGFSGSIPVARRRFLLHIGGIDTRFKGHGAEDFFLLHQLHSEWRDVARPPDYPGSGTEAAGLRALATHYRERSRRRGLFLVHRFHARPAASDPYRAEGRKNWTLLYRLIDAWDRRQVLAEPNAFISQALQRHFGQDILPLSTSTRPEALRQLLAEQDVRCVLLGNPKARGRAALFDVARQARVPAYCVERGPLEDSAFLDPNGFNVESASYGRDKWDRPLSAEQAARAAQYTQHCRASSGALERQAPRRGGAALRRDLALQPGERVLFVPLQSPGDTVIRHWSDWVGGMAAFAALADRVAAETHWRVLVKRHPVDTNTYRLRRATASAAHYKDLLEASDAVLTINSGIGVQALIWNRPTLVAGRACYQFPELNTKVGSLPEILGCLQAPPLPDPEAALRFIYYLKFRFCCDVRFERSPQDYRLGRTGGVAYRTIRHIYPDWLL